MCTRLKFVTDLLVIGMCLPMFLKRLQWIKLFLDFTVHLILPQVCTYFVIPMYCTSSFLSTPYLQWLSHQLALKVLFQKLTLVSYLIGLFITVCVDWSSGPHPGPFTVPNIVTLLYMQLCMVLQLIPSLEPFSWIGLICCTNNINVKCNVKKFNNSWKTPLKWSFSFGATVTNNILGNCITSPSL